MNSYGIGTNYIRKIINEVRRFTNNLAASFLFIINLSFEDGSIGSVIYTSNGNKKFSKEHAEFFADNKVAVNNNFRNLYLSKENKTVNRRNILSQDKGHRNEFDFLVKSLRDGNRLENEFKTAILSSRASIAALKSMISGQPERV